MLIPIKECIKTYNEKSNDKLKGAIYFGKNLGKEGSLLVESGIGNILWVESEKNKMPELYNATKFLPMRQQYICDTFSNVDRNGQSMRFDSFYKKNLSLIELENYNLILNLVDFGNELNVLEGFGQYLTDSRHSNFKAIYTKIRGTKEMDDFLMKHEFKRVLFREERETWGEAFYIKL